MARRDPKQVAERYLGAFEDVVLLVLTQRGPGLDGGCIAPTVGTETHC